MVPVVCIDLNRCHEINYHVLLNGAQLETAYDNLEVRSLQTEVADQLRAQDIRINVRQ